jgi:thiamine biosynthesis protein ThiS
MHVTVTINGEPRELAAPATVAELLAQLEMPARGVAVEVNLQIVPRARHAEHVLADGDRLEIVSLVGGG